VLDLPGLQEPTDRGRLARGPESPGKSPVMSAGRKLDLDSRPALLTLVLDSRLASRKIGRGALTGFPKIMGTRGAQKVVASRQNGSMVRKGSCYYSELGTAAYLRGRRRHLEVAERRRPGKPQAGFPQLTQAVVHQMCPLSRRKVRLRPNRACI